MPNSGLKTIEVPFATGLSQKTDPLWSDVTQGAAATETNLVSLKAGTIQKRLGLREYSHTGSFPALQTQQNPQGVNMVNGQRAFTYKQQPCFVGEGAWTQMVWSLNPNDTGGVAATTTPIPMDLAPEAYISPPRALYSTAAAPLYIDSLIYNGVNGYRVTCFLQQLSTGTFVPYYMVQDAGTNVMVVTPRAIVKVTATGNVVAVRMCVVTNGVVFVLQDSVNNLYGTLLDMTNFSPSKGPAALTLLNQNLGDGFEPLFEVFGDGTNFWFIYMQVLAGPVYHIHIRKITVSTMVASVDVNVDGSDAVWTADKGGGIANATLSSCTLRADSGANELAFSYGWNAAAGAGTGRVSWGLYTYTAPAQVVPTINLMTVPGPLTPATMTGPVHIAIERVGSDSLSTITQGYKVAFSPAGTGGSVNVGWSTTLGAGALIAHYIVGNSVAAPGTALIVTNQPRVTWGALLVSKLLPVTKSGGGVVGYMIGWTPSDTQGGYWLFCDDAWNDSLTSNTAPDNTNAYFPLRLVGNIAPRQALFGAQSEGGDGPGFVHPHISQNIWDNKQNGSAAGNAFEVLVYINTSATKMSPYLVRFDLQSSLNHQACELGENAMLACGSPSGYDGTSVYELGFPLYPVITNIAHAAGGSLSAGTYSYIAIFEWTDVRGQVHRSGRSVPVTVVAANGDKATLTITNHCFSAKVKATNANVSTGSPGRSQGMFPSRAPILIKVYRSVVNAAAPINYFNIDKADFVIVTQSAAVFSPLSGPTTTVVDANTTDAQLQTHPLLYGDGSDGTSSGNLLDNYCAPSFQGIITHNSRLWGIDGNRIWPSKAFTPGEGSAFNEAMAFSVDDGPNDVLAVASMDDKFVMFKNDRILYTSGFGPADNGLNNDLIPPVRITSDVGITDWRSIVSTPDGIYFMSPVGRKLLTRDLQVKPIPFVENVDQSFAAVTSAVIHPTEGRVIWTQQIADQPWGTVGTGVQVVYDYILEHWSTSSMFDAGQSLVSACIARQDVVQQLQTNYFALRADGFSFAETQGGTSANVYFDQTAIGTPNTYAFVVGTWQSPWLKADGLQGWSNWKMIRLLVNMLDPASITVTIAYRYASFVTDTFFFTGDQITNFLGPFVQLEMQPTRPREESMQITISDALWSGSSSTVSGQGFKIIGMRVDYEAESGGYRTPVAQRG